MSKYIGVFHHWWMESKRFKSELLDAKTWEEAEYQALKIKEKESSQFNRVSYYILEIADVETVLQPVKPKGFFRRLFG